MPPKITIISSETEKEAYRLQMEESRKSCEEFASKRDNGLCVLCEKKLNINSRDKATAPICWNCSYKKCANFDECGKWLDINKKWKKCYECGQNTAKRACMRCKMQNIDASTTFKVCYTCNSEMRRKF